MSNLPNNSGNVPGQVPKKPVPPAQPGATRPPGAPVPPAPQKPAAAPGIPAGVKPPAPPLPAGAKPLPPPAPGVKPAAPAPPGVPKPAVPGTAKPAAQGVPGVKPPAPAAPGAKPTGAAPTMPPKPAPPGSKPLPPGLAKPPIPGAPKPAAPAGAKPATPGAMPPKPAPANPVPPGSMPPKPAAPKPVAPSAVKPAGPERIAPKPNAPIIKKSTPTKEKPQASGRRKIGQVLIDLGFLDEAQLGDILEEAANTGQLTGQVCIGRGVLTEDQLLLAIADQLSLRVVNLEEQKPTPEALQLVPETMYQVYKVFPLTFKEGVLTIVTSDTANIEGLETLRTLLNIAEIKPTLASQRAIEDAAKKAYAGKEESIGDIIKMLEEEDAESGKQGERSIDLESLMEIQDSAPVRKLINMVFLLAIRDKASDIHFEPFEEEYKLRMKAEGVLFEMVPPPRHLANAISSRIKVMANLDISEKRMPQDGRIELNVGGNAVDLRVSVLPTLFGESICLRVLDRTVVSLDLNKIGMPHSTLETFKKLIHKPNGIVLVTGPTGSGKTTTLYSALNFLNVVTDKLITTEDPIEYDIDGIVQVPINAEVGLTFASALRAILRQDPDKVLVGEIRDLETAQIAIQAALTGHTVFSTLHTNDAPSTITRLKDMGVEHFLLTATLEGILAQRLVRRICVDCRTPFDPSPDMLMQLNLRPADLKGKQLFYGKGCDRCNNTGYKGRTGLYELIEVNDTIRDLISAGASTDQISEQCKNEGMMTLREAGLNAMYEGHTSIEEVVYQTVTDD